MLLKPRLPHKPKDNFRQDFPPAILLGEGVRAGRLGVKTVLEADYLWVGKSHYPLGPVPRGNLESSSGQSTGHPVEVPMCPTCKEGRAGEEDPQGLWER